MQNLISNFESLSEADLTKYAGEWIAVIDNSIVAHGSSFKEVYDFVKQKYPKERALFGKAPEAGYEIYTLT